MDDHTLHEEFMAKVAREKAEGIAAKEAQYRESVERIRQITLPRELEESTTTEAKRLAEKPFDRATRQALDTAILLKDEDGYRLFFDNNTNRSWALESLRNNFSDDISCSLLCSNSGFGGFVNGKGIFKIDLPDILGKAIHRAVEDGKLKTALLIDPTPDDLTPAFQTYLQARRGVERF